MTISSHSHRIKRLIRENLAFTTDNATRKNILAESKKNIETSLEILSEKPDNTSIRKLATDELHSFLKEFRCLLETHISILK
jgi:hypothetical protein